MTKAKGIEFGEQVNRKNSSPAGWPPRDAEAIAPQASTAVAHRREAGRAVRTQQGVLIFSSKEWETSNWREATWAKSELALRGRAREKKSRASRGC